MHVCVRLYLCVAIYPVVFVVIFKLDRYYLGSLVCLCLACTTPSTAHGVGEFVVVLLLR